MFRNDLKAPILETRSPYVSSILEVGTDEDDFMKLPVEEDPFAASRRMQQRRCCRAVCFASAILILLFMVTGFAIYSIWRINQETVSFSSTTASLTPVCQLPIEPGNCNAKLSAWGFNTKQRNCQTFNYTGCHGNENRFNSKELCESTCLSSTTPNFD